MKKRGPKNKPDAEKKVAIRIWVKKKYFTKAKKQALAIERIYNTKESKIAV